MPKHVSATEAKNALGRYLDASQTEPITIEKMGRAFAVLISQDEYEALQAAATRGDLPGGRLGSRCGFAATKDHKFDEENQWLNAKKGFDRIASLSDNWDGAGSSAPSAQAVDYAWRLVTSIYEGACRRRLRWVSPHVGADEHGSVSLEWWYESRKLTLFVELGGDVTFLKSWGDNIHQDMEDGMIDSTDDFARLSRWLYQGHSE